MTRVMTAILLILLVIYSVPFLIYGSASVLWGLQPPTTASPSEFLLGVLLTKLGHAAAFVVLFAATRAFWGPRWLLYAAVWFVMFVFSEIGEAVSGRSTGFMAVLGVVSEAIYLPVSAFVAHRLLRPRTIYPGESSAERDEAAEQAHAPGGRAPGSGTGQAKFPDT